MTADARPGAPAGSHRAVVAPTGQTGRRGAGLASVALPRAAALTDLLAGDGEVRGGRAGPREVEVIGRHLERELAGMAGAPPHRPLRVTGYLLRTALVSPGRLDGVPAFRWSAATARRRIGVVAVRACVAGSARTPAEGVAENLGALAAEGRRGIGRPGSLTEWVGRLPAPALAVVGAEATTWATRLWTAVEWGRLGTGVRVGGPAERWSPGPAPTVSLVGQADVRAVGPEGPEALLTVLAGAPGPGSRAELGLAALVAALAARAGPGVPGPTGRAGVPERVAGWWPDCGRALVVPVDGALLQEVGEAVLRAARELNGRVGAGRGTDRAAGAGR